MSTFVARDETSRRVWSTVMVEAPDCSGMCSWMDIVPPEVPHVGNPSGGKGGAFDASSTRGVTLPSTSQALVKRNCSKPKGARRRHRKGLSDAATFVRRAIPVVALFTGLHGDYHETTDDADTLNYDALGRISHVVYDVTRAIAEAAQATLRRPAP